MAHGVRKVSERILRDGRAIIVTDKDRDNYDWADIPDGSKFIDTETGVEYVKLKGETDWVPAHLKNDGTISIAKDAIIEEEVFIVKDVQQKEIICENENGDLRHFMCDEDGYFVIELEDGTYTMGRNHLTVIVNDLFVRTQDNEGIIEMTPSRFKLIDEPALEMKISAKYYKMIRIGNPYPRIFVNPEDPGVENVEEYDIWIDTDGLLDNYVTPDGTVSSTIPWSMIKGTPTTLQGYKITDKVALEGHVHTKSEITDFPTAMPANGGNSDTVAGRKPGTDSGNLAILGTGGKIPAAQLAAHTHSYIPTAGGTLSGNIVVDNTNEVSIAGDYSRKGLYFNGLDVGFKDYSTGKTATITANISGNAATATKATTATTATTATYATAIAEPKLVKLYESSTSEGGYTNKHGNDRYSIDLSEPYTNFKMLYIEFCNDSGHGIYDELVQVWQLKRRHERSKDMERTFFLIKGWYLNSDSTTTYLHHNDDAELRIKRIFGIR